MKRIAVVLLALGLGGTSARQAPQPIIDMHLHALEVAEFEPLAGPAPIPHCVPMTDYAVPGSGRQWPDIFRSRDHSCRPVWSPTTDDAVMEKTLEIMTRRNVFGVTSGRRVDLWKKVAPGRIIPSLSFGGGPDAPSLDSLRKAFEDGRFAVFGEVTTQYAGLAPDDPSLDAFWTMAATLDAPVGIHIGTGPVGAPYVGFDRYRARLHSPLLLEEVLVRHPAVRVYIMHAAWPMLDDLLAVLWTHPQVYVEVGAIDWALPRPEFHRYLRRIVESGFGKRVLFGSDQMIWPDTLDLAIQSIESADFLSREQKRDIYFNNAARFLRLTPPQLAAMQGGG
jgi:predicted TIM-barrel fold metal-dependent hydrolase